MSRPNSCQICVCICTYKRPHLLDKLLSKLQVQRTDGLFTYSIVIVDNDRSSSGQSVVNKWREKTSIPIDYYVEPENNIAAARNKAVQQAKGEYVACIDDDEFPDESWLFYLYQACCDHKVDGVLAPVIPYFESTPPKWVVKGKFCDRPSYQTGTLIPWNKSRLGNVLIKRNVLHHTRQPFNEDFRFQGEDVAFFKDLHEKGHVFVWCKEAPVYELVSDSRCQITYFLRRAFVQGNVSLQYNKGLVWRQKIYTALKSVVAMVLYTIMLPFCLLMGAHTFMKYLIKDVHHASRLLALFRMVSLKERGF